MARDGCCEVRLLVGSGDFHLPAWSWFKPIRFLFEPRAGRPGAEGGDHVVVRIQNFDDSVRCKLIAAGSEFHGRRNFLRSDENAARVIAIERECVRVILPALSTLPKPVAGATQSGSQTRSNTIFRHRAALVKRYQTPERRPERVASFTINWGNHCSPHALDGSFGFLSGSGGECNGQSRNEH
jgi:hypothetical protein